MKSERYCESLGKSSLDGRSLSAVQISLSSVQFSHTICAIRILTRTIISHRLLISKARSVDSSKSRMLTENMRESKRDAMGTNATMMNNVVRVTSCVGVPTSRSTQRVHDGTIARHSHRCRSQ